MLKKRNAQGLSITTIIVAVIGLIILVVLVAVFTGRIGSFGKGLDTAKSCQSACQALGKDPSVQTASACTASDEVYLPGKFATPHGTSCCCED